MTYWRILGRSHAAPPNEGWRDILAKRIGQRPRRIGIWAELALSGALACLDDAGEGRLPDKALLSVSSATGPDSALRASLEDMKTALPMPFGFLQSQPGQVLPVLASCLGWSGNGRCLSARDPLLPLFLASIEAVPESGFLLGWVEEGAAGGCRWLRAVAGNPEEQWMQKVIESPAEFGLLFRPEVEGFAFEIDGSQRRCYTFSRGAIPP